MLTLNDKVRPLDDVALNLDDALQNLWAIKTNKFLKTWYDDAIPKMNYHLEMLNHFLVVWIIFIVPRCPIWICFMENVQCFWQTTNNAIASFFFIYYDNHLYSSRNKCNLVFWNSYSSRVCLCLTKTTTNYILFSKAFISYFEFKRQKESH